jgi:hypothetical protein
MPSKRVLRITGAAAAGAVLLTALGFGIASTSSRSSSSSSTSAAGGVASAPARSSAATSGGGSSAPKLPGTALQDAGGLNKSLSRNALPAQAAARVIQTGQIALQVQHGQVRSALDRLGAIATGAGGFLSDSREDEGTGTPSGTSTLRVPVADFPAVVAQVRKVGRVTSSSSSARDVTSQYVDLSARINALQQTRSTYLTLLSKATTIGDTLTVQQQIQQVQTQIEQLQGQQKVLVDSSDLATLAVSVSEAGAVPPPVPTHQSPSGFGHALHRAVAGFNHGLQAIITVAGPLLLVLLVLGLFALLGQRGYRVVRRWQA